MATIAVNTASAALKQLFDRQMAKAVELDGDTEGIKALFPLLEQIGKTVEGAGRVPFVIVVQNPNLTLSRRMVKVVLDGKTGASYIADGLVANLSAIPRGYYLMVDVEDGRAMRGISPGICLQRFKLDKRFGGSAVEGITVVSYEVEILLHHYLDLPGSRYEDDGVPFLRVSGRPELNASWNGAADQGYGSLSCRGRLGPGA